MVNLLLACSAAVAGALIGSVSGDLIINKRIAVDTSEGVENAKVVEIPKRENKKAIPEKKNVEKEQKNLQPKESDANTAESPNRPQDQNDEPAIEKVTGEVVETTTSEPVVEQQIDETKAAEVESQNQDLSGTPDEPNIVTNTDETQPAQFTPIDKHGESEQQATTENKKAKGGK